MGGAHNGAARSFPDSFLAGPVLLLLLLPPNPSFLPSSPLRASKPVLQKLKHVRLRLREF